MPTERLFVAVVVVVVGGWECWDVSGKESDIGRERFWSFPIDDEFKIFAADNIVWISWISSAFAIDGNANWRTARRIWTVSALAIGLKLISSFDIAAAAAAVGRSNWGAFLRKYWTVVWINNSLKNQIREFFCWNKNSIYLMFT